MLSNAILAFLIFLLSASSAQCFLMAALYRRVAAASPLDRRMEFISVRGATKQGVDQNSRKRSVEATLHEVEETLKARTAKPSLLVRMRQAQLDWSKSTYYVICGVTGLVTFLLVLVATGLSVYPAVGFGISAGLLFPHWYVTFKRSRRFKRFTAEFANAVDVIVRGVKVGLPLGDCLKI